MNTSIIVAGDFCPQNRVADEIEKGNFSKLYDSVKSVVERADYAIVNFECPIATEDASPITKCGPLLRCNSRAVQAIEYCGFDAVTLANNHFMDYGAKGAFSTLAALDAAGIEHMGGGMNIKEAATIHYKKINGNVYSFINCCENEFSIANEERPGSNPLNIVSQCRAIKEARRQSKYVIVIIHGGSEGCQYPSPRMQDTYRYFIESGADVVINHHQHCYSGFEYYMGKPICYGLGNFSFDKVKSDNHAAKRTKWNEGYVALLNFSDDDKITVDAVPYIQASQVPSTVIMEGKDRKDFDDKIAMINEVVKNPKRLEKEYNKWVDTNSDWYRIAFEPWGRGLRILRKKGLLPSLVSKQKWLTLADYMICEAHNDRVKRYFYQLIDKYNKNDE